MMAAWVTTTPRRSRSGDASAPRTSSPFSTSTNASPTREPRARCCAARACTRATSSSGAGPARSARRRNWRRRLDRRSDRPSRSSWTERRRGPSDSRTISRRTSSPWRSRESIGALAVATANPPTGNQRIGTMRSPAAWLLSWAGRSAPLSFRRSRSSTLTGISVFALVYVLAHAVERIVELTLSIVDSLATSFNREPATTTKSKALRSLAASSVDEEQQGEKDTAQKAESNTHAFGVRLERRVRVHRVRLLRDRAPQPDRCRQPGGLGGSARFRVHRRWRLEAVARPDLEDPEVEADEQTTG